MTERAYFLDPAAYRADQEEMKKRINASPAPPRQRLIEQKAAELDVAEQRRREAVERAAAEGLKGVAKHIGNGALLETANLLGITWKELEESDPKLSE